MTPYLEYLYKAMMAYGAVTKCDVSQDPDTKAVHVGFSGTPYGMCIEDIKGESGIVELSICHLEGKATRISNFDAGYGGDVVYDGDAEGLFEEVGRVRALVARGVLNQPMDVQVSAKPRLVKEREDDSDGESD